MRFTHTIFTLFNLFFILVVFLNTNQEAQAQVIRGPYLQKATTTSMVIRWRTQNSTQSIVDYGTDLSNLNLTTSNLSNKTEHVIEITGLDPNTQYYYQISNNNSILVPAASDLHFTTLPPSNSKQAMTFWALGDCGTANDDARDVRDAYYSYIGNNHTDAILFLGDNAYTSGTDAQYQTAVFQNMYEDKLKNTVAWSCLGNHDGYTANSNFQTGNYYNIFTFPKAGESGGVASGTEAFYSFDYGNVHFISMDSYETNRAVGGMMYDWCEDDIQNTLADWIVVFFHHPPYTKGSHDSDLEVELIQMRQNFLPMLEANGVDLVLSGHSHSYERSYLINGHYGNANTFNINTHPVGPTGDGDGKVSGDGVYFKEVMGPDAGDGAVYVVTGSAGKITEAPIDHQAMYYSEVKLGSTIIEVECDQMDVKFLRSSGVVSDFFTIEKDLGACPGDSCDDLDDCTVNDVYDDLCECEGTFQDSDQDGTCDADEECPPGSPKKKCMSITLER